jgi:hypothetical protein
MLLPDINVLVRAHNADSAASNRAFAEKYRQWPSAGSFRISGQLLMLSPGGGAHLLPAAQDGLPVDPGPWRAANEGQKVRG